MAFKNARKERGAYAAEVVRTARVSPHMTRVTIAGEDLTRMPRHGFDQWFRLFLPRAQGETDFSHIPEKFGIAGYAKFLRTPSGARPAYRNYTVRELRPESGEMDIDFVAHGKNGLAGPWAQRVEPGERIALIDQGRGFDPADDASFYFLVGDESALPAIVGILRDLPRYSQGLAIIEIPSADDKQATAEPEGFEVRWIVRVDRHATPGTEALEAVRTFTPDDPETLSAYVVGERILATEGRRHLVGVGVPKHRIEFVGYWRADR